MPKTKLNSNQLDIELIPGYDSTKTQTLVDENGTLKWKTEKICWSDFNSTSYIDSNETCPSYTSAEVLIKLSACYRTDTESYGQVFISSSSGNTNYGFRQGVGGGYIDIYNGSNHIADQNLLDYSRICYWFKGVCDGSGNTSLYSLPGDQYTLDTLPTNISDWTFRQSCSGGFTFASKNFRVGASGTWHGATCIIYECIMKLDNELYFDLQSEDYKVYGTLKKDVWYE